MNAAVIVIELPQILSSQSPAKHCLHKDSVKFGSWQEYFSKIISVGTEISKNYCILHETCKSYGPPLSMIEPISFNVATNFKLGPLCIYTATCVEPSKNT